MSCCIPKSGGTINDILVEADGCQSAETALGNLLTEEDWPGVVGFDDKGHGMLPSLLADIAKQIADAVFRLVEKQGSQGQHLAIFGHLIYVASQALHGPHQL